MPSKLGKWRGIPSVNRQRFGSMGRFGANIVIFVLNNEGYLSERALEENPERTYNNLALWRYSELPKK